MTMHLSQLQRAFQDHVMRDDAAVIAHINESGAVAASVRLGVYADAYHLRLVDALAHNYPRLQQLLGREGFARLGRRYLDECPSTHVSVRWFGHRLAGLLNDLPEYADQPWLAELADWEWAIAAAFDAADVASVDETALGQILPDDWPGLRFAFHPSVHELQLQTNAPALFKALSDETECPAPEIADRPQAWLIWRQELTPRYRSMEAAEKQALATLLNGGTFEQLCESLCEWHEPEDVPVRAATLLKGWVSAAMLTEVIVSR